MKKIVSVLMIVALPVLASAQNKAIEQMFHKYSGKDGFTSIVITKNMFQLFANVENPENDDFLRTVKNLDFIKILTAKGEASGNAFYKEVMELLPEKDYKELMVMQESGEEVKFMTAEKDGVIRELIMVSRSRDESAMIWMAGIIDMKTVGKIAQSMNIEGMDDLNRAEKK